jgi:uncharacterized membrane protein YqjE
MPFVSSLKRLLVSVAALFHNRLELASIEVEEAALRLQHSIILSLCALLCGFLALALFVVLCIVLFWDHYRIAVISGFIALFGLACLILMGKVRQYNEAKPALLAATLAELRKDIQSIQENSSDNTNKNTPPSGN